jgi:pyrroloquinoline quinone biosynthesis protein E
MFREARALGAVQLGFSGGEALTRDDLEELIAEAHGLGYYTNLITSGVGMDEPRIRAFKEAGLDHIQIKLSHSLEADYVELATTQYYGWAMKNWDQLFPSRDRITRAEAVAHRYQRELEGKMRILYVVPDYFEDRPKACMRGWGGIFLTITPNGTALPCHAAGILSGLDFSNVRDNSIEWIWKDSPDFNKFRGNDWMKEPCRTCPEREKDYGGCRCQAYLLTGDAANADPVCSKSPHHAELRRTVEGIGAEQSAGTVAPIMFRNMRNSKQIMSERGR